MCEIFFAMSMAENKPIDAEVLERLVLEAVDAAHSNDDGWGIFDNKRNVLKSEKQLDFKNIPGIMKTFRDSRFVVMHVRQATHGSVCVQNTHPFNYNGNLFVHNGIVHGEDFNHDRLPEPRCSCTNVKEGCNQHHESVEDCSKCPCCCQDKIKEYMEKVAELEKQGKKPEDLTDSEEMLRILINSKGKNIPEKIKTGLKRIGGSFSCFLYGNDNNLYYFRETSRFLIGVIPSKSLIVGATDGEEVLRSLVSRVLWGINVKTEDVYTASLKEKTLYEFSPKHGLLTHGEFEIKPYSYQSGGMGYVGGSGGIPAYRSGHYDYDVNQSDHLTAEGWVRGTRNTKRKTKAERRAEKRAAKRFAEEAKPDITVVEKKISDSETVVEKATSGFVRNAVGATTMGWQCNDDGDVTLKIIFDVTGKLSPRIISWDKFWYSLKSEQQEEIFQFLTNDSAFVEGGQDDGKCASHCIPCVEFDMTIYDNNMSIKQIKDELELGNERFEVVELCPICVAEFVKVYYEHYRPSDVGNSEKKTSPPPQLPPKKPESELNSEPTTSYCVFKDPNDQCSETTALYWTKDPNNSMKIVSCIHHAIKHDLKPVDGYLGGVSK